MATTVEYRVVYLRPNPISDEAIAVAVIHNFSGEVLLHTVAHPKAILRLDQLYGVDSRKRILDGLRMFTDAVSSDPQPLEKMVTPVDLFSIGSTTSFYTEQPDRDSKYILHQVSSLYTAIGVEDVADPQISQRIFTSHLRDEVSFHNVMAATAMFRGCSVPLGVSQNMKIPIYGDKVAGIAVSFKGASPSSTKTTTEAFIARMLVAQKQLARQPVIYSLSPSFSENSNQNLIDGYVDELRMIGKEAGVAIRNERSIRELALSILRDDEKLAA